MNDLEISPSQARDLTDRIRVGVEAIWELVKQAYQSRAWSVLGYESWDDYCTREFGTSRIRLPREERQEVVSSMREIGMSTRAIASATGSDRKTIMKDVRNAEVVQSGPPESENVQVTGTDGKTYTPKPRDPEPEESPIPRWEDVGTVPPSKLKNLRPSPAPGISFDDVDELNQLPTEQPTMEQPEDKPRAEAITSRFTSAIVDLNRVMAKFDRIANDPNFPRHKEKVAALHRHDLTRSISELQALADQLN